MKSLICAATLIATFSANADIGVVKGVDFGMTPKQVKAAVQETCTYVHAGGNIYASQDYVYADNRATILFQFEKNKLKTLTVAFAKGIFYDMVNNVVQKHTMLSFDENDNASLPKKTAYFSDGITVSYGQVRDDDPMPYLLVKYTKDPSRNIGVPATNTAQY